METRFAILLAVAITGAGGLASFAATSPRAASYDREFEDTLFYRVPEGFRAVRQPAGIFIFSSATAPDSTSAALVLTREILVDPPLRGSEARQRRAALARSIAEAIGAALVGRGALVVREEMSPPPPRGGRIEVRSFSIAARKDGRLDRSIRARVLFDGAAFHLLIATAPAGAQVGASSIAGGFERLYASLGFARLGDRPPERRAPPLPDQLPPPRAGTALGRGEDVSPQRDRTGPQCRVVQRQQCSGGIGTSLGYFCTTVPRRICH